MTTLTESCSPLGNVLLSAQAAGVYLAPDADRHGNNVNEETGAGTNSYLIGASRC